MYCCIHLRYHLIYQYNDTFSDIEVIYLEILFFKALINLSATTDFPSLCVEYITILLSCSHFLKELL